MVTSKDRPTLPSDTAKTRKMRDMYDSDLSQPKLRTKIIKIFNIMYSSLNKVIRKCLCRDEKTKTPAHIKKSLKTKKK
jgi:hypothetical protein